MGIACGLIARGRLLNRCPDAEMVMSASACECCGTTAALRTNGNGRTLCVSCDDRAHGEKGFDLGGW
jgi:hypothetical protein